ncbi:MAG: hypothetical protein JO149_00905 [Gammaproteobacteria bacterium]|nr:hypothetical protein [Gammaproteobacteria bacterium]
MSRMDLLKDLFRLDCKKLSKNEKALLEMLLFVCLVKELLTYYNKEILMENNLVTIIINDLLINNEYSIDALANYTNFPEEVIYDLAAEINTQPTLALSMRLVELHAIARRDLYSELVKKVIDKFLNKS